MNTETKNFEENSEERNFWIPINVKGLMNKISKAVNKITDSEVFKSIKQTKEKVFKILKNELQKTVLEIKTLNKELDDILSLFETKKTSGLAS